MNSCINLVIHDINLFWIFSCHQNVIDIQGKTSKIFFFIFYYRKMYIFCEAMIRLLSQILQIEWNYLFKNYEIYFSTFNTLFHKTKYMVWVYKQEIASFCIIVYCNRLYSNFYVVVHLLTSRRERVKDVVIYFSTSILSCDSNNLLFEKIIFHIISLWNT